MIFALSGY